MISTRELAALIWLTILVLVAARQPNIRAAMLGVLQAFLQIRIVRILVLFGGYIAIWIRLAEAGGFWERMLLKDTIVWVVLAGLPLLFQFAQVGRDSQFFTRSVRAIFAASVFLEFALNVTSFSLPVEMVLLPVATFLGIMPGFVRSDEKYAAQRRFWDGLLGIAGFVFVVATWREIYVQRFEMEPSEVALSLALLLWLPLVSLPFVCTLALTAEYELAFMRMKFANRRRPLVKS